MNHYQAKLNAKRDRLENAADRAQVRADAAFSAADMQEEKSGIPMGQPILIGHHSEGKHRRALERANNNMSKSVQESKRAEELRARAANVGTGGINAQDPEALTKLREKISSLEAKHTTMKSANSAVKSLVKKGITHETEGDDWENALAVFSSKMGTDYAASTLRKLLTPQYGRVIAFESFQLTNNNAKIKAAKKRLANLEAMRDSAPVNRNIEGICTYIENPEMARLQLVFDGKPSSDVCDILKAHGFKWAPSENAWQRQLNNNSRYSAKLALNKLVELSA